jgi:hypothetical protein
LSYKRRPAIGLAISKWRGKAHEQCIRSDSPSFRTALQKTKKRRKAVISHAGLQNKNRIPAAKKQRFSRSHSFYGSFFRNFRVPTEYFLKNISIAFMKGYGSHAPDFRAGPKIFHYFLTKPFSDAS